MSQWEKTAEFNVECGIVVSKYLSKTTGLQILLANFEGPLVSGYFALSTEAHDDDGCPHTLEHLIFLGSEEYPYKGVLDTLANRNLAQGTNAWTDTDNTAYTLTCAGGEGFLAMLPVFLDHVLYPTITDSGCYTEVHHVNGEGVDAGVVYCEMQGRENTDNSRTNRRLQQLLFAGTGYTSETGGIMENLRSLSVDTIRKYHRDFYRPDNLCLVIAGNVTASSLFAALAPVEARIVSKGPLPPMSRPWSGPVPPLATSVSEVVEFPDEDEEAGPVMVGWRGPAYADFETRTALKVLLTYLTDTAVAPLMRAFVETDEPLCTDVNMSTAVHSVTSFELGFENVGVEHLDTIEGRLLTELSGLCRDGVDIDRMQAVAKRMRLKYVDKIEQSPNDALVFTFIHDFLYGTGAADLGSALAEAKRLDALAAVTDGAFWVALAKKYMVDAPHVCVRGRPSAALGESMRNAEASRIEAQRGKFGEIGLTKLAQQLDDAQSRNSVPIPPELIARFSVPSLEKITFVPVTTVSGGVLVAPSEHGSSVAARVAPSGAAPLPIFVQFDHVKSEFVEVNLFVETTHLADDLRQYLEIYLEAFFETPVVRGGETIDYDDVVRALAEDTISTQASAGLTSPGHFSCGRFSQMVWLRAKCEPDNYEKVLAWMRDLFFCAADTPDRLRVVATKLASDVTQHKREGSAVVTAGINDMLYDRKRSTFGARNHVRQHAFLTKVLERLEAEPEVVVAEVAALRRALTAPNLLRAHVVGDMFRLRDAREPWNTVFLAAAPAPTGPLAPVRYAQELFNPWASEGAVVPVAAVESGYINQCCPAPNKFGHPDAAPLMVLIEYLTTMEGAFWKQIRGLGLAYGYSITLDEEEGLLYFSLYRASQISKAYAVAKDIVENLVTTGSFDKAELEAARASVIFGIIARESTMGEAAQQAFENLQLRRVGHDYNHQLLRAVGAVTADDVVRVTREYMPALFSPGHTRLVIVTNPAKSDDVISEFAALGRNVAAKTQEAMFGDAE